MTAAFPPDELCLRLCMSLGISAISLSHGLACEVATGYQTKLRSNTRVGHASRLRKPKRHRDSDRNFWWPMAVCDMQLEFLLLPHHGVVLRSGIFPLFPGVLMPACQHC